MGNCCGGEEDNKDMTIGDKKKGKGAGVGSGTYGLNEDGEDGDIFEYCNSKVKAIFNDLDSFDIPSVSDGTKVETRPMKVLDNDARY